MPGRQGQGRVVNKGVACLGITKDIINERQLNNDSNTREISAERYRKPETVSIMQIKIEAFQV